MSEKRDVTAGMRKFLEMVGLIADDKNPSLFLIENLQEVAPGFPDAMSGKDSLAVAKMLHETAEGGSIIAFRLAEALADATGQPIDAILAGIGRLVNDPKYRE